MKVLYAIQGTGNGHLTRAHDIGPILRKKADVDILLSGTQADISLPFPIDYHFKGLSFKFGKKGGIDVVNTLKNTRFATFWRNVQELPVEDYDLIINDFEPISAWAASIKQVPCIGLSHQAAVLNKKSPQPAQKDFIGLSVLKHYAPTTIQKGFHFKQYDKDIYTPIIRPQIRQQTISNNGHYTVYLPAYGDEKLIDRLSTFTDVRWEIFSKHTKSPYSIKNITIRPIHNKNFIESIASCEGVLCGAGFETPAEALYLRKKLMVIPMKAQYEQQCNAVALKEMGVDVIKNLKKKQLPKIEKWLNKSTSPEVHYPNDTENIIETILGGSY